MSLSRLTKITGPGVSTDTNWVGNNANFTGVTTTGSSFNVGLTTVHSTLIEAHNIKSTGIITATGGSFSGNVTAVDGTFSGNVSIAGTLTYEDVTNIDSVGIITSKGADINGDLDVDGHTNLDNVSVAGVTTFSDGITFTGQNYNVAWNKTGSAFNFSDGSKAVFGTGSDMSIYHDGSNSWIKNITGNITINSNTFLLKDAANQKSVIRTYPSDRLEIYHNNIERFRTLSTGVRITGTAVAGGLDISGDIDVDGHTNLDNVSVAGVSTFHDDVTFIDGYGNSNHVVYDKSISTLSFPSPPNSNISQKPKIVFGDRGGTNGTELYNDFYNTHFKHVGYGAFMLSSESNDIYLRGADGSGGSNPSIRITAGANQGVKLYHGGNLKFETAGIGASVYGTLVATGADINGDLDVDGHTNLDNVNIVGVTTFSSNVDIDGNTTFGANGSITSSADFHLSSNSLRVTGGSTVVGEFKGTSIPTVQVTQTTNNTDLQLRANSEGGLVRTATNYPLILGANQREKLRIAGGSYATIGINTSTFDNAGAQLKIEGRGTGTTSPPYLQIKGVGNANLHSYVDLIATSDSNAGNAYRGLGVVMYDEPTNVEWFAGRPYAGSDKYIIGRKTPASYRTESSEVANQLFRLDSDGKVTFGDGNNLAANFVTNMLIDGGDNTKLSILGGSTGTGTIAFPDGSSTGAQRMAGFIQMNHTSNDNGPRLNMGLNDTTLVHIRVPGSNRGQLEVYGNFNESDTPAIEISDGGDARKVYLTNSSGDFNALTRNGSQTKGQLKMFESGMLIHNMKNPDATSTLQTLRTSTYKVTSGSTYTSISPIQSYMQKGDPNNYGCFEEANCTLEVNGGGNDHYQPVGFVPRGYNLDTTSFGGQWAGEMWIHQTGSQNPESYGYSGFNNWATMSFKCRWDCAHWNAKPSGFWVEHYINYGRGNIGKIDASGTQSQFVIYLLPGQYKIRWNAVRGMQVHRPVSDGAALVMRDGGSFVTYNTLAYSSRNTAFDSEITPGSGTFAYCT